MNKTQTHRGMGRSGGGIVGGGIDGKLSRAYNNTRHGKSRGQRRRMEGAKEKEMRETRKHKGLNMLPGNDNLL